MTEKEYIRATNLAKVFLVMQNLKEVLPDNEVISEKELSQILRMLSSWWHELSEITNLHEHEWGVDEPGGIVNCQVCGQIRALTEHEG